MNFETFHTIWKPCVKDWLDISINGKTFSDLCRFKNDAENKVYINYLSLKKYVKEKYFIDQDEEDVILNRYKRASVLAYTIIKSNPIKIHNIMEPNSIYLKQNFAFFFAVRTTLFDYKEEAVKKKKIYLILRDISRPDDSNGNDPFLLSVYKDFFFAERYKNFDVLGTANMFGLLFDYVFGFTQYDLVSSPKN